MPHPQLLIATRNPGKMREYRQLLQAVDFELVSLDEVGVFEEVEETGLTFEENAVLKAGTYAGLSGLLTLADDSGLEVDALGGEPGIHSARYGERLSEPKMSDQDRVDLLLRNLEGVAWERRTARFRCVIAVVTPAPPPSQGGAQSISLTSQEGVKSISPPYEGGVQGGVTPQQGTPVNISLVVGSVAGMIQYEPEGQEGFGYDPVFYLPSYSVTMAQLPLEEKNRISHRGNAAGKALAVLKA